MKRTIIRIGFLALITLSLIAIWVIYGNLTVKRLVLSIILLVMVSAFILFLDKCDENLLSHLMDGKIKKLKIIDLFAALAVIIISILIRVVVFYFKSDDYLIFNSRWVEQIKELGWHALGCRIGNYSPMYMNLIIILSMMGLPTAFVVKVPPILFDYGLGAICVMIVRTVKPTFSFQKCLILFALIILNPITVLNSAAWGQCDSLYSFFILASLYAMIRHIQNKNSYGDLMILLAALAFAFKLQAIFFLPVILLYLLMDKGKNTKLSMLIYYPALYIITALPALFAGKSLKDVLMVYFSQSSEYSFHLTCRYYNFFTFVGAGSFENAVDASGFTGFGILLAFTVVGLIYYYSIKSDVLLSSEKYILITCLTVLTLTFFLPSMHERYAYIAEILIIVLAVSDHKYIPVAFATILCTLVTYGEYLSNGSFILFQTERLLIAFIRLAVIACLTKDLLSLRKLNVAE